jgi:quercetin dioxygenase-like cupin family protein
MNHQMDSRNAAAIALASLLFMPAGETVCAEEQPPKKSEAIVKPLITQDLAGIPGKEAVMATVEYLPGGASLPHRHDADVFVYVLEGSIVTQVDGKEAVTLKAGDTFHESPTDIHRKSANASATQPAKFLVFMVKDKGKPTTRPVDAK